jgi:CubicO group peptidase (beta-lactamase class C family)
MPDLDEIGRWTTGQLPALIAEYKVLGAASGVYRSGEVFDFAVGVRSHVGKAEATADSVFQIDPIIRNRTAGLAARLADTGLLDIDQPVVHLPDFDLADSATAKVMTVRQALGRTTGFENDIFSDTGTSDDAAAKDSSAKSTQALSVESAVTMRSEGPEVPPLSPAGTHRERDTPTPLEPEYGIPHAADIHRRRRRRRAIPLPPQRPGPPARRLTPSGRDL